MSTLQKDSRVTVQTASREFAYWETPHRQSDWWGSQFFSGVSSLTMKTSLQVRLAWWDWFLLWKEKQREQEDKEMGLVSGQCRGAASKQPHCNAASLLSSVPWCHGGSRLPDPGPRGSHDFTALMTSGRIFQAEWQHLEKKTPRSYKIAPLPKGSLT